MKRIEERVADAIAELENLLKSGESPDAALCSVAAAEDLRPEVLRVRAGKALGDLQIVKAKNDQRAKVIEQRRLEKTAIYEFAGMDDQYKDFPSWFEERTGRKPQVDEVQEMERLSWEALLKKVVFEL